MVFSNNAGKTYHVYLEIIYLKLRSGSGCFQVYTITETIMKEPALKMGLDHLYKFDMATWPFRKFDMRHRALVTLPEWVNL